MRKYINLRENSPFSVNSDIRRHHFAVFTVTGSPTYLIFLLHYLFISHQRVDALFIIPALLVLAGGFILVEKTSLEKSVYRLNAFFFGLVLLQMTFVGGEEGSRLFWMYLYPLCMYFLMGKKEGFIWNSSVFLIAVILMCAPFSQTCHYSYSLSTILRFVPSFLCVSLITHWFEHYRESYRRHLREKTEMLQKALNEVKTLKGYLPVCASCRRVKTEEGSWTDLESYVRSHSEAEISHGLCSDCARELYPEIMKEIDGE